jgi:hypothetical protein
MFYVYAFLREDGSPYYVGKGTRRRAWNWRKRASFRPPSDASRIKIVGMWDDEQTAFAYERYLIDFWGRKDTNTGILHNLTDGGEGSVGYIASVEARNKIRESHRSRKPVSKTTRLRLSISLSGKVPWNKGKKITLTEEGRARLRAGQLKTARLRKGVSWSAARRVAASRVE